MKIISYKTHLWNRRKNKKTELLQSFTELFEKPNKDKIYISNWRPISSLNFDLKVISKSLAARVKRVLSNLIDARQTSYVNYRFIGESSRLIDDIIEVCDIRKTSAYPLTVDFKKAFDSFNHKLRSLKKLFRWVFYWLDQNVIKRLRILRN